MRYNNIVVHADVDGMHIRLLLITFFFSFPELIKKDILYILQATFQSYRNKETIYCYSDDVRRNRKLKQTRNTIQGIGRKYPDEFKNFIGETIRLDPIMMDKTLRLSNCLSIWVKYARQTEFIIKNLKVELDMLGGINLSLKWKFSLCGK
jgi:topoisomerase-4 subunit B